MSYPINPSLINNEIVIVDEVNHKLKFKFFNAVVKNCESGMMENSYYYIDDFVTLFPVSSNLNFDILNHRNAVEYCRQFSMLMIKTTIHFVENVYSMNSKEFSNWVIEFEAIEPVRIVEFWYSIIIYYTTIGFDSIDRLVKGRKLKTFPKGESIIKEWTSPFINESLLNKSSNLRIIFEDANSSCNSINVIDYIIYSVIIKYREELLHELLVSMNFKNVKLIVNWNSTNDQICYDQNESNREKMLAMSKAIMFRNSNDQNAIPNYVISEAWINSVYSKLINDNKSIIESKFKSINEYTCELTLKKQLNDVTMLSKYKNTFVAFWLNDLFPNNDVIIQTSQRLRKMFITTWCLASIIIRTIDPTCIQFDLNYYLSNVKSLVKWLSEVKTYSEIKLVDLMKLLKFNVHYMDFDNEFESIKLMELSKFKSDCFNTVDVGDLVTFYGLKWKTTLMARLIYFSLKYILQLKLPTLDYEYDDFSICTEDEIMLERLIISNFNQVVDEYNKLETPIGEATRRIRVNLKCYI